MKPKQRWLIIGSLLLATLAGAYFVEDEPAAETGKKKARSAKQTSTEVAAAGRRAGKEQKKDEPAAGPLSFPEPPAARIESEEEGEKEEEGEVEKIIDPFRNKSWFVAPPPPPPSKPVAPPLPFKYLGKLIEDGEPRVFLDHQGKYLIARLGDVINGTYSVEEIAGGRMTFLYQPLKEKQTLSIGPDN